MWVLLVSRLGDPPGSFFDRRQIDSGEVKVGRSLTRCDLVLADDTGIVSRQHCLIRVDGLDLTVTDLSKNGVALNDPEQRIVPGQAVPIRPGDRLLIHDYVIAVTLPADLAGRFMSEAPPPPLPAAGGSAGDDIWGVGASDPLGGYQGAGFGGPPLGFGGDPLGGPVPSAPARVDPIADFGPDFGPGFGPDPGGGGFGAPFGQAYEPRPIMAAPIPAGVDLGIPEDWASPGNGVGDGMAIADFDLSSLPAPARTTPPPLPAPAPVAVPRSPAPAAPAAREVSSPSPPPAPPTATGAQPDWSAFYEGAGFTPEELALPPDAMHKLGVLYRQVVLGLCDILQDRATFKDEFRIERTQLASERNNPLKRLAAFEAAQVIMGPPLPGFMAAEEAVRASFQDIKRHQMAMMAGVQSALVTAFARLSPEEMTRLADADAGKKKKILGLGGVDRWSIYASVYETLRKDAMSNANGIMSSAFRDGYERYMKTAR